ncbi:MAG: hypothetical protein ED555_07450 [Allomuricauda sp.]|nr:MAG: hypothetical protein ED555_07450 [Allomuricauda sp.]
MKKLIHNLLFAGLFIAALSFTSCQEEFEEVGGNEQETLMANSDTAALIVNTSTNDGSFDNIVDGASCFAVKFPYTVDVGGIQITIDSEEDLELIEDIFDEFDTDEDVLDILFPITITLGDFTEIVIENVEQLIDLAEECREGGDDDDIECIDFVYPITLFTYDINSQQTGSVVVESDKELRQFFAGLEGEDLVGIDYPVTLKKYDGTTIEVNSNAELAMTIEAAKDECDEDDDNDFNDDDFDEDRFDFCLTECPWKVITVERDGNDRTVDYEAYLMNFTEDGGVTVKDREGNVLNGEWSATFTDRGPLLTLEFDTLVDFSLQWLVYEVGEHRIKLFAEGGNKIIMQQLCEDDGSDVNPDSLREILKECEWIIKRVKLQDEPIRRLLGFEFKFLPGGVATLTNGDVVSEGTWEVGYNEEQVLALLISFGDEPAVNFNWPLRDLDDDRLKFSVEEIDYELILQRVCDDNANDGDVVEIRSIMMDGSWSVAMLETVTNDGNTAVGTEEFAGLDFYFNAMHQVQVDENDNPITTGLWRVIRNYNDHLVFYLNMGEDAPFDDLTEAWYITEVSADRIELVYEDEYIPSKVLVFEKNM